MPVLEMRVSSESANVRMDVLCAGYESGAWRSSALVDDNFDRHLLSFALNYTELQNVSGSTALGSIRDAAVSVYTSDKYKKRGEFGEMLLHGALIDFFSAEPAVSKIYYEDTANHVVKGFDGVHLVDGPDGAQLWLGESKFYADASSAVDSAVRSIEEHLDSGFLRKEFLFITRKLDERWPRSQEFAALLARTRSLDEIIAQIVVPIFVTYNSEVVGAHSQLSDQYRMDLEPEVRAILERLESALSKPLRIEVRLILLPIKDKAELVALMDAKLKRLQAI